MTISLLLKHQNLVFFSRRKKKQISMHYGNWTVYYLQTVGPDDWTLVLIRYLDLKKEKRNPKFCTNAKPAAKQALESEVDLAFLIVWVHIMSFGGTSMFPFSLTVSLLFSDYLYFCTSIEELLFLWVIKVSSHRLRLLHISSDLSIQW
jgi:hypothetical protein